MIITILINCIAKIINYNLKKEVRVLYVIDNSIIYQMIERISKLIKSKINSQNKSKK